MVELRITLVENDGKIGVDVDELVPEPCSSLEVKMADLIAYTAELIVGFQPIENKADLDGLLESVSAFIIAHWSTLWVEPRK